MTGAATELLTAWEVRQQRLITEAEREERRLLWLEDMLGRWGKAVDAGGSVDLKASDFLAREASGVAEMIRSNKRVAVPQALLYDLSLVQDALASVRRAMLAQFEALDASGGNELGSLLREQMGYRRLNMAFVRELAADPNTLWAEARADERAKTVDLGPRMPASADQFVRRLFTETAVARHAGPTTTERPGLAAKLKALATRVVPQDAALPWKTSMTERLDPFRELVVMPAEVHRVTALHSAWQITSTLIQDLTGRHVEIEARPGAVAVISTDPKLGSRALES